MNKHILVLSIVAVCAAAAGVWLQYQDSVVPAEKDFLFVDLLQKAAQIERVEINNSSGKVYNAYLKNGQWIATVNGADGTYPVQKSKLSELLGAFSAAKLVEAKTAKPANYQYLGLQSLDVTDSLASLVMFSSQKDKWQVLVGNQASIGRGSYVRSPDKTQSWLIDQNIVLPTNQQSWFKQPVLPFEASFLQKISRIGKQQWVIEKSADGADYILSDTSAERVLKYESILSAYAANIASLNFDELHDRKNDFWDTLETRVELEIVTTQGIIFTLTVAKSDDKVYVKFNAENQQAYWLDWVYQISSFSAQQLSKTKEDFLREVDNTAPQSEIISSVNDEGESPQ